MSENSKRTGLFLSLGCGCLALVILAVFAVVFLVRGGLEGFQGIMGDMAETESMAQRWQPPADGSWDENDWPGSLAGGWALGAAATSQPNFLGDGWSGRQYQGADGSAVTIHVGATDAGTQQAISTTLAEYTPSGGSRSSGFSMGPRQTRRVSSGGAIEAYEFWTLDGWSILVEGQDGEVVKDAAAAFLASSGGVEAGEEGESGATETSLPSQEAGTAPVSVPLPDEVPAATDTDPETGAVPDLVVPEPQPAE